MTGNGNLNIQPGFERVVRERCGSKDVTQSRHKFAVDASFQKYYARERGMLEAHVKHAMALLGSTDLAADILARVAKTLAARDFGRPWGWIGEIIVTYLVENEPDVFGRSILTNAAWRTTPGGFAPHVDLVGLCVEDGALLYAESKARAGSDAATIISTTAELRGQLERKRIDKWRETAYDENVTAILAMAIRRGLVAPDSSGKHEWLKRDGYRRIGHVVSSDEPPWFPLMAALPADVSTTHPVHLMTTGTKVVAEAIRATLEWEAALQEAATKT